MLLQAPAFAPTRRFQHSRSSRVAQPCRAVHVVSAPALSDLPPCVLYEDEHLLVVHKPAGLNTHAPAPHAVDGIYDWLRCREPRWASLAIHQRLDKETSGVLVFGLSPVANKNLTEQLTARTAVKSYTLLAQRPRGGSALFVAPPAGVTVSREPDGWLRVTSGVARRGERYVCSSEGDEAVTLFRELGGQTEGGAALVEARPLTGRTHQIRVHAAALGAPLLGDALYGGAPSSRLWLHASSLTLTHPASGRRVCFEAPRDALGSRAPYGIARALVRSDETDIFRLQHGRGSAGDARAFIDCLGDTALVQSEEEQPKEPHTLLGSTPLGEDGTRISRVMHKRLRRDLRTQAGEDTSPTLLSGVPGADSFCVLENRVRFGLRVTEGYSVGLFHDQRENRRRLLTGYVAPGFGPLLPPQHPGGARAEVLNVFSYTCGFSLCAAMAGARATSLDLSRKYLTWGEENFALNGVDPAQHDFIFGDAFDWLARLARKGRLFSVVLLDPPTFSTAKGARFSAEQDYGQLVAAALRVLAPGGVLFCSTNAARLSPVAFLVEVHAAVADAGRQVAAEHFATQPPDFSGREEPAYLKTVWLRVQ